MHKPLVVVVLWTVLAPLSGCLFEGDRPAGRLSVQLDFEGPEQAPEEVEWWLYSVASGCVLVDTGREPAATQGAVVRFQNLEPGIYELYVQATNDRQLWQSGCAELILDRFEEYYACTVYRVADGTEPMESDRCGDPARSDAGQVEAEAGGLDAT